MKYTKIIFVLLLLFSFGNCKDKNEIETGISDPGPAIEPYEQIYTSFNMPDLNLQIDDTTSICSTLPIDQELDWGGPSGFHYRTGFTYNFQFQDIELFRIWLHVRGLEEIGSSAISIDTILDIYETYPQQCFVRLLIKMDDIYYSNISYTSTPYDMSFRDPNAIYASSFIEVNDEDGILDCYESAAIIPMEFKYDGFIFTNDLIDSLRVENLSCQFAIFQSF